MKNPLWWLVAMLAPIMLGTLVSIVLAIVDPVPMPTCERTFCFDEGYGMCEVKIITLNDREMLEQWQDVTHRMPHRPR